VNPDCDKLLVIDVSPWKVSAHATLVALEHTIQFNPFATEINAKWTQFILCMYYPNERDTYSGCIETNRRIYSFVFFCSFKEVYIFGMNVGHIVLIIDN
jgi:hypothetical protein